MKTSFIALLVQWKRWRYAITRYMRRREEFPLRTRAQCWKHAWSDLVRNETRIVSQVYNPKNAVKPATRQKLYAMMGGDSALVERMIQQTRKQYRHLSEQEIWEQAIRQLERDRF